MSRADRIRLQHMLDAAREAMSSLEGRTRADLERLSAEMERQLRSRFAGGNRAI